MPSLNQIIEEFRRGLELRDRALLHRISAAYHEMAANILDELKPLQSEMEAVRSAGGEVTQAWLIRERRLSSLLAQVQKEMHGFAIEAIDLTTKEQWKQVEDAIAHTLKVISIQTPEGVSFAFNRLSNRAIQAIVGATSKGSPLRKLFDEFGEAASRGIRKELVQGVALGQGPAKTARRISDYLGGNAARALTIARTETIRAYRESGRQTALENTDILEGWTWVSALVGSCAACIAMHGTKHPVDERMETHPNCFPAGTIVSGPRVEATTARWYSGEVIELETVNGRHLTVTPNHPILTLEGWIPAALLNEGGHVLSCSKAERVSLRGGDPNNYQVPALIEEVANTCGESSGVPPVSVPTAPEDFHGDGRGSEVAVVRTNRELGGGFNPQLFEPEAHRLFSGADIDAHTLPRAGSSDELIRGALFAPNGVMCSGRIPSILFERACAHHQSVRLSARPNWYALFAKTASDDSAINAQALRDGVLGFAGSVPGRNLSIRQDVSRGNPAPGGQPVGGFLIAKRNAASDQLPLQGGLTGVEFARDLLRSHPEDVHLDRIVKVSRTDFAGHVYNLQTVDGWYVSNGIITHNCRCVQRWDTKSWQELGMKGTPETGPEPVEPGAAWFARQPEAMQIEVLGKAGFQAYKSGRVKLEHFVGESNSPEWGKGLFQQSLKAALRAAPDVAPPGSPAILIPGGEPIAPKLKIPPIKGKHLSRVLGLIDGLHGDGPLHDLPVKFNKSTGHFGAFHRTQSGASRAVKITISDMYQTASDQEFTFAHELGHYLDFKGMGTTSWFASETPGFSSAMTRFLDAVSSSPEIDAIRKSTKSHYREYLLRPREIWARAYAQWVATQTNDPGLLTGLEKWRASDRPLNKAAHWTNENFEPIMRAIDDLLLELGWRTNK